MYSDPWSKNVMPNNTASPASIDDLWIKIEPGCKLPERDQDVFLWTRSGGLIYNARYASRFADPPFSGGWGSRESLGPVAWMPRPLGPR